MLNAKTWLIVGGVAAGAYVLYRASGTIERAVHAIDPTNSNNVFASAVNHVVSPSGTSSLGTKIYDFFNAGGTTSNRTVCGRDTSGRWTCKNIYVQ